MGRALELLGYRVCGPVGTRDPDIARKALALALTESERHDAFQDNPWPVLFREMDERHPGSKFVLTLRPAADWIRSACAHFGHESTPMRAWIYGAGAPLGNEQRYLERYGRHERDVRAHFAARPADLLVLALPDPDPWAKLCPFLGAPRPAARFPWINRDARRSWRTRLRGLLRR